MIDGNFMYVKALQWTTGIPSLNIEGEQDPEYLIFESVILGARYM